MSDTATKTFTFEGKSFAIWHDAELGSYALLSDLCEIHWCGTPSMVLPRLDQSVGIEVVIVDDTNEPGSVLVNLDNEAMVTIRELFASWSLAVRFREWLVKEVFRTSPHREHDEAFTAKLGRFRAYAEAETGIPRLYDNDSAEECREWRWREELKARGGLKLVWSKPPGDTVH